MTHLQLHLLAKIEEKNISYLDRELSEQTFTII